MFDKVKVTIKCFWLVTPSDLLRIYKNTYENTCRPIIINIQLYHFDNDLNKNYKKRYLEIFQWTDAILFLVAIFII